VNSGIVSWKFNASNEIEIAWNRPGAILLTSPAGSTIFYLNPLGIVIGKTQVTSGKTYWMANLDGVCLGVLGEN